MKLTPFFTLVFAGSLLCAPLSAAKPGFVLAGVDVLESQEFALLKGKQVGLITNHTGVTRSGRSTADLLAHAPGVKLIALFSPEHGIRGKDKHGENVGDLIDPVLHLPVYSLYGSVRKPSPEMMNSIDVLVFDMQDVGARFYTYLTTMGMAMEAASERGIAFVVLDRPNPAGGSAVEGQVLDSSLRRFTAYYEIPVRHGMTAGEIAVWYKETHKIQLSLTVVPLKNWTRDMLWPDTGRVFVAPSPNIRNPTAALLYSGIGMFETMNISVGRGTETPFELIGAPWINAQALSERLEALKLPGLKFQPVTFTPSEDLYAGKSCSGVRIKVTDPKAVRTIDLFVYIVTLVREFWPKELEPRWDEVALVTGSKEFQKMYEENKSALEIIQVFHQSADAFVASRQTFLLY